MPHAGTHVTIAQRMALQAVLDNPQLTPSDPMEDRGDLWPAGNPRMDDTSPAGLRAHYACLGAIGPDIFYLMMDFGADIQDLMDFLMKLGGSFEAVGSHLEKLDRFIKTSASAITHGDSYYFTEITIAMSAIMEKFVLGVIAQNGFNFWSKFPAKRQEDRPREEWYWADMFHYIKTGVFAQTLWDKANLQTDPLKKAHFRSFALGYMTHYVTDTVGHPYVNQVVQSPWRDYWQRHYLVENFMDAYVWDQWHSSNVPPIPQGQPGPALGANEPDLDTILEKPNGTIGLGAPYNYARLNDWINIGTHGLNSQIDALSKGVGDGIQTIVDAAVKAQNMIPHDWNGWAINFGQTPMKLEVDLTKEQDVLDWATYMADCIMTAYPLKDASGNHLRVPERLKFNVLGNTTTPVRASGYPTAEDIAQAYATTKIVLKMASEAKLLAPELPSYTDPVEVAKIEMQLSNAINQIMAAVSGTPPVPSPGGSVSLSAIFDAVHDAAVYLAKVATATANAVATLIDQLIHDAATMSVAVFNDLIKCLLYHLSLALYALYEQASQALMLEGYSTPATNQLDITFSAANGQQLKTADLWQSHGNLPAGQYPIKESVIVTSATSGEAPQRTPIPVKYHPTLIPNQQPGNRLELPAVPLGAAPFTVLPGQTVILPDVFIQAGNTSLSATLRPNLQDMFTSAGPSMTAARDFGTALDNCYRAMKSMVAGTSGFILPDYNLDGDRGYGWPCWELETPPKINAPTFLHSGYDLGVLEPLSPHDRRNIPPANVPVKVQKTNS